MSRMIRNLVFLVLVAGAVALPILTYRMLGVQDQLSMVERQRAVWESHKATHNQRMNQFEAYKKFHGEAQRFLGDAKTQGVMPSAWSHHKVSFSERRIPVEDLEQFISDTNHGAGFFFAPKRIGIKTEMAKAWEKGTVGDRDLKPSTQVTVSLDGEYLVKKQ